MVIARVPGADGFYAQGTSVEEARAELADVIEGNVLLALQLNLPVPALPGVDILDLA
jgi:predicted RNase H-like HicB family nuclease